MALKIRWKRVLLDSDTCGLMLSLIAYRTIPRAGCEDRQEDLQQLGFKNLANGSTAPVTVEAY
ncbi:hypothetical protein [Shewanella indica]